MLSKDLYQKCLESSHKNECTDTCIPLIHQAQTAFLLEFHSLLLKLMAQPAALQPPNSTLLHTARHIFTGQEVKAVNVATFKRRRRHVNVVVWVVVSMCRLVGGY